MDQFHDFEVEYQTCIRFPYNDFYIEYCQETDEWYAQHEDVERFPDRQMIEFESDEVDILLFDEYTLTKEEFDQLRDIASTNILQ